MIIVPIVAGLIANRILYSRNIWFSKGKSLAMNPCNVDKIFRKIKQFGYRARQAGGVFSIEMACWDLAGKAWGVPCWQMLDGKFRDKIRVYCDTPSVKDPEVMGKKLKERMEHGIAMALHMAGSPVTLFASVHCAAATENFMILEHHNVDDDWYDTLVDGVEKPIFQDAYIKVPDGPGLGIELNEKAVKKHLQEPGYFEPTPEWDNEKSWDRTWSYSKPIRNQIATT